MQQINDIKIKLYSYAQGSHVTSHFQQMNVAM